MMGFFGHKHNEQAHEAVPTAPKQLSADSSVGEWLDHPVGGAIFRQMLSQSGQDEGVLRPVHGFALKRLIGLSGGKLTQQMVDDMVQQANSGQIVTDDVDKTTTPTVSVDQAETPTAPQPSAPAWRETITPNRFAGKTVIVTGAGSGIGRATASRVAREGGRVIAVDISAERLDEFKASLPDADITIVAGDITDAARIASIIEAAGDHIDALANVAGIMDNFTPLHEVTDQTWDRVLGVNLVGMMKLTRAVLPAMLQARKGTIVNVGSEASLKASAAGVAYTTSKHAVVGLSKSTAFMYGPSGIRTNVVAPGAVLTNIEAKFESELGGSRVNAILPTMPTPASAEELAAAITFLLSDDSSNINGAVLTSDGGWSVQ